MAKMKRTTPVQKQNRTLDEMISQVVMNKLESHLAKMVVKTRKESNRAKVKLNQTLALPHLVPDEDVEEAEYNSEEDETPSKPLSFRRH